jgi:hypothetical protein
VSVAVSQTSYPDNPVKITQNSSGKSLQQKTGWQTIAPFKFNFGCYLQFSNGIGPTPCGDGAVLVFYGFGDGLKSWLKLPDLGFQNPKGSGFEAYGWRTGVSGQPFTFQVDTSQLPQGTTIWRTQLEFKALSCPPTFRCPLSVPYLVTFNIVIASPPSAKAALVRGPAGRAYFEVGDNSHRDVFVVAIDKPSDMQHARSILKGQGGNQTKVMGVVVKRKAAYNDRWPFHLDPKSVSFFEQAIEECDATIRYVSDHLADVGSDFLPDYRWCPWTSYVIREVDPRATTLGRHITDEAHAAKSDLQTDLQRERVISSSLR